MTPLVLLHGFTGHPAAWQDVRAALSAPRPVFAPSLLGHAPEHADARDFDDEVDRLAARLRALRAPVHLCGYSLGARVALLLLARHPELIACATLISARPPLAGAEARSSRALADARWAALLGDDGLEAFLSAWEAQPLFAGRRALAPEQADRLGALRRTHQPDGLIRSLERLGLARMPDLDLTSIRTPVQLVAGSHDEAFAAHATTLAARLPHARVTLIPGTGHDPTSESPAAVALALEQGDAA